jgi:hypothetical protein
MTCRDLSRSGWEALSTAPERSRFVTGGRRYSIDRIRGVLTLLPVVFPRELTHIVECDRDYVAAEMTAFLIYWLSALPCPVLNDPQAGSLCGPNWRPEQWAIAAENAGIPTRRVTRSTCARGSPPCALPQVVRVTLVGERCSGTQDDKVCSWMKSLAAAAKVRMLSAVFARENGGFRFASAHAFADMGDPQIQQSVVDFFSE